MVSKSEYSSYDEEVTSVSESFFSSIASWLIDEKLDNLYVEGTTAQINAVKDAMLASKDFQNELHDPDATLQTITEKLQIKSRAARVFESKLGMPWLL